MLNKEVALEIQKRTSVTQQSLHPGNASGGTVWRQVIQIESNSSSMRSGYSKVLGKCPSCSCNITNWNSQIQMVFRTTGKISDLTLPKGMINPFTNLNSSKFLLISDQIQRTEKQPSHLILVRRRAHNVDRLHQNAHALHAPVWDTMQETAHMVMHKQWTSIIMILSQIRSRISTIWSSGWIKSLCIKHVLAKYGLKIARSQW